MPCTRLNSSQTVEPCRVNLRPEKVIKAFQQLHKDTSGKRFYRSETDIHRDSLIRFCTGSGIDVGYGGDPIRKSAITIDYSVGEMASCGDHPLNLDGDARQLKWFQSNALDYVYSSHCLEDFENTGEELECQAHTVCKTGDIKEEVEPGLYYYAVTVIIGDDQYVLDPGYRVEP